MTIWSNYVLPVFAVAFMIGGIVVFCIVLYHGMRKIMPSRSWWKYSFFRKKPTLQQTEYINSAFERGMMPKDLLQFLLVNGVERKEAEDMHFLYKKLKGGAK